MQSKFEVTLSSSRKRSDVDIIASILGEARKGAKKTRIMYRCNLSHRQLQVYLKFLLDMKLLMSISEERESKTNFYQSTTKGRNFLDAYCKLKELMRADAHWLLEEHEGAAKEAEEGEGE
jgi:predicted transcriptional regulator